MLIVTPLRFLGGAFYSIDMLSASWRTVALFNPVVYLISGFRWSFYGSADVAVGISLATTCAFLLAYVHGPLRGRLAGSDFERDGFRPGLAHTQHLAASGHQRSCQETPH